LGAVWLRLSTRRNACRCADDRWRADLGRAVGAVSVFKAFYADKRELKCACVGGNSNVPLEFISLTENLMMVAMALWMGIGALG
jgi:hypothetical protein